MDRRVSMIAILGLLTLSSLGCGADSIVDTIASDNKIQGVSIDEFPLRKLDVTHGHRIDCRHDDFLAIRNHGELHLIVGGSKADRFANNTLTAFDLSGDLVWKLSANHSVNNPRPYVGKSANVNDRELVLNSGSVIADLDGDGMDDIYCSKGGQRTTHVALISGQTGDVIVQSKIHDSPNLASPFAVYDLDLNGTDDLHFCLKGKNNHAKVMSISGSDLTTLRDEPIELKGSQVTLALSDLPDESGDGIHELLLQHQSETPGEGYRLSVVDGKTLKVRRTLAEPDFNHLRSSRFFLSPGDIDGDKMGDIVICMRTGSKSNEHAGYMACYSGADVSELWYLESEELGGPRQDHLTKKNGELVPSGKYNIVNQLGNYGAVIRDLDSDSTKEIVVSLSYENAMPQRQRTLVVISGTEGAIMKKLELPNAWADEVVIPLSNPESSSGAVVLGMNGSIKQQGSNFLKVEF